jgi:hypothetical protein
LSLLSPFSRALLGIPFLYQKVSESTDNYYSNVLQNQITSSSPITALISTKNSLTSFAVVHLDGRLDWIVAQRSALLAWTGHALTVKPRPNLKMV